DDEDEPGGDDHSHGQVPSRRLRRLVERARRRDEASGDHRRGDAARIEGEERQREATAERQRVKAEHRDREGEASNGERGQPSEAPRHRGVRDREHGGGGHAPDRSRRGGGGKARALLEREEQRDRAGGERKADEPPADRWSEAATDERRGRDERWGQNELQREDQVRSTARVSRSISAERRRPSVTHVSSAFAMARRYRGSLQGGSSSASVLALA